MGTDSESSGCVETAEDRSRLTGAVCRQLIAVGETRAREGLWWLEDVGGVLFTLVGFGSEYFRWGTFGGGLSVG